MKLIKSQKLKFIVFGYILLSVRIGFAQHAEFDSIRISNCKLQNVIHQNIKDVQAHEEELAKNKLPIQNEYLKITNQLKNDQKLYLDKYKQSDLIRASELKEKLKRIEIAESIEANRKQDLDILVKMALLADDSYRWDRLPSKGKKEASIWNSLTTLTQLNEQWGEEYRASVGCDIVSSLEKMMLEPSEKLEVLEKSIKQAISYANFLNKKYSTERIDLSKLNKDELKTLNSFMEIRDENKKTNDYLSQLHAILFLGLASESMYQDRKNDFLSGSETKDKTIDEKIKNNAYGSETVNAVKLLLLLNDQLTSDKKNIENQSKKEKILM